MNRATTIGLILYLAAVAYLVYFVQDVGQKLNVWPF